MSSIAKKHNIKWSRVNSILKRYKIPTQSKDTITKNRKNTSKFAISDDIKHQLVNDYTVDQLSITQLTEKYKIDRCRIKKLFKNNNITFRSCSDISKLSAKSKVKPDFYTNTEKQQKLKDLYLSGASTYDVAKEFGVTSTTIRDWLTHLNIPIRDRIQAANCITLKEKKVNMFKEKYGVVNPMQIPDVFDRSNKSRYKFKEFEYGGKQFTKLQGYEPQAIVYMVEQMNIPIEDVYHGKQVPHISYNFNNKSKTYFPDLFVPTTNTLYEVKSTYTYNNMLEINKAKRQAAINAGYNHITIVFEQDAKTIHKII